MGSADYINYYKKMDKKQLKHAIECDTNDMGHESGHSYSGTWASKPSGINFINQVFNSEDEAEEYILEHNDKWDCVDAALVRYKAGTEAQNIRIKKEIVKLEELIAAKNTTVKKWFSKLYSSKSKTKGCSCGKRVITTTIQNFECSCGKSYVSSTDMKKIQTAEDRITKQWAKRDELIAKRGGKVTEKWVVGGWCSS